MGTPASDFGIEWSQHRGVFHGQLNARSIDCLDDGCDPLEGTNGKAVTPFAKPDSHYNFSCDTRTFLYSTSAVYLLLAPHATGIDPDVAGRRISCIRN